jgi:alpha-galactosidase
MPSKMKIIELTVVAFLATLLFAHADSVRLDELDLTTMTAGWGQPQKNQSVSQTPLALSGEKFDHGVGTHAESKVIFQLDGKAQSFTAKVGVDDDAGDAAAAVEFVILGDGRELWSSGVCKLGDKPRDCSVDLDGIKILDLIVAPSGDDINYDHADWADATFEFDGVPPKPVSGEPEEEAVVLTPPSPPTPLIHGAKVFGVHPGSPFLFTVAATGDRPMIFSADNLPLGLVLDSATGRITGTITDPEARNYQVTLHAKNALGTTQRPFLIKVGETIALTPPMGWNSWNCFAGSVSDAKIRAAADAMVKSGLINHGWTYINIDDFWQVNPGSGDQSLHGPERDANGTILPNSRFPDMKALARHIHDQGLKAGLYSSPGPYTCGGCTGSYQHEDQDARQYAAWGFDYLKYDWCTYDQIYNGAEGVEGMKKPYRVMAAALGKTNRDIVFSFCEYGRGDVWKWGAQTGGNSWRTTTDIQDNWHSMLSNASRGNGIESYADPGHWNDPDMLVVGKVGWGPDLHATHLTPNEQYTHISLWCLQAAPLLLGCDLTQLDPFTLGLLTNDEVLDVDQDPLGQAAHVVHPVMAGQTPIQIWARQLEDGSTAVGLFNLGYAPAVGVVNWSDLNLTDPQTVRDLWRQKDLGTFDQKFESEPIPPHGVLLIRLIKS